MLSTCPSPYLRCCAILQCSDRCQLLLARLKRQSLANLGRFWWKKTGCRHKDSIVRPTSLKYIHQITTIRQDIYETPCNLSQSPSVDKIHNISSRFGTDILLLGDLIYLGNYSTQRQHVVVFVFSRVLKYIIIGLHLFKHLSRPSDSTKYAYIATLWRILASFNLSETLSWVNTGTVLTWKHRM